MLADGFGWALLGPGLYQHDRAPGELGGFRGLRGLGFRIRGFRGFQGFRGLEFQGFGFGVSGFRVHT